MLSRRHTRWHCNSLAQRLFSPSDPQTSGPFASRSSLPGRATASAASKVPYILPSSVYSNSFVFTLFTKLPGCMERIRHFPFSLFHFQPRLSSLECAVPRFRLLTPLECAVAKMRRCNSFRMRSYKKTGGRGCLSSCSIF